MKDLDEGFAKLDVKSGVDDRVDGAVEVSKPGDGAVQWGRDAAAPAVGLQHVCEEERQPADDEHTLNKGTGSKLEDKYVHVFSTAHRRKKLMKYSAYYSR